MEITSNDIKQALHKADLSMRPWIVFINPVQAKALRDAFPKIEEEFVIQETEFVEIGKAIAIERKKMEEWMNYDNEFR